LRANRRLRFNFMDSPARRRARSPVAKNIPRSFRTHARCVSRN